MVVVMSRDASACALAITGLVRPPWFGMPRRCIYTLYRAAKEEEKGEKKRRGKRREGGGRTRGFARVDRVSPGNNPYIYTQMARGRQARAWPALS